VIQLSVRAWRSSVLLRLQHHADRNVLDYSQGHILHDTDNDSDSSPARIVVDAGF